MEESEIVEACWSDENEFYRHYGRAVYFAQLLERKLAIVLCFHEARRRGVLKRPSPEEIDTIFNEADANPIGDLLRKLEEFHCLEPQQQEILRLANKNRRTLVHHFSVVHGDKFGSDTSLACIEVQRLAEPIATALRLSEELAQREIQRMQEDALRPFKDIFGA